MSDVGDLSDLIERVVRSPGDEYNLGGAGWWEGGLIHGTHVTDDPRHVLETLRSGTPLVVGRTRREKYGDLGPGLYFSAAPQLWVGRSTGKWDFLKTLEPAEAQPVRERLATAILVALRGKAGHLTKSEKERAVKYLADFVEAGSTYIVFLADQPYNVRFWEPKLLTEVGITPGKQAQEVEVVVRGVFAELRRHPSIEEIDLLQSDSRLDGAFVRSGFSTYPQFVVWNNASVVSFAGEMFVGA